MLKYKSLGFVFSVGITPANAAAALASIRILKENQQLVDALHNNSELFLRLAKEAGFDTGESGNTPIIPIILKDSRICLLISEKLKNKNINVMPIIHPAVAENEARLRFFLSALHTEEQIRFTVEVLKKEYDELVGKDQM